MQEGASAWLHASTANRARTRRLAWYGAFPVTRALQNKWHQLQRWAAVQSSWNTAGRCWVGTLLHKGLDCPACKKYGQDENICKQLRTQLWAETPYLAVSKLL